MVIGYLLVSLCSASVQEVNPFIGSGGIGFGVGSIPPGAQVPFGMMRLGPDTAELGPFEPWYHCGGYYYPDHIIRAFSHTHLVGAGVADLGHIGVMPVTARVDSNMVLDNGYQSTFNHSSETAKPGYYAVTLDTWGVRAELTATRNAGVHRYTFSSATKPATLLIDAGHDIHPKSANGSWVMIDATDEEVYGYSMIHASLSGVFGGVKVFFSARFNQRFVQFGTWNGPAIQPGGINSTGIETGAFVTFDTGGKAGFTVEMSIGISFVSLALARQNLISQVGVPSKGFDAVRAACEALWEEQLADITVVGGTPKDRVKFYSALYRAKLAPTTYSEEGGFYLGFDRIVHSVAAGQGYYSDMSIWDIHRTQIPLTTLTRPSISVDITKSLLLMAEQGGDLPRWPLANGYTGCMMGTHANEMIVDALLKAPQIPFNVSEAYNFMKLQATVPRKNNGLDDLSDWLQKGYLASDKTGSSSAKTMAYSFDSWAVATVARVLGKMDDFAMFMNRTRNYRVLWSPKRRIFCGKTAAGKEVCPDDDFQWGTLYMEGNAAQWRWFAPQDIPGLITLFGGAEAFVKDLDEFIDRSRLDPSNFLPNPYYWAGNEPDILAPWMFVPAGKASLTQKWTRWLVDNKYTDQPDGIPGNDDYGTMSAWEVFAYLGFYPLAGSDTYFLGSPYFPQVTVKVGGGRTLTIIAHDASQENVYVKRVLLNGAPLLTATVTHSALMNGTLEFWMGPSATD